MLKKIYLIYFIIFISLDNIYSNDFFSFMPYLKYSNGIHGEHLYYSVSEKECSYLEWEEKNSFLLGIEGIFKIKNFNISLNSEFGIPKVAGKMYDSDWIYTSEFPDGLKTTYSISENHLKSKFNTEILLNYDFNINKIVTISPGICFQYSYLNFNAKNGYGWYGSSNYSTTKENVSWDSEYAKYYKIYGIDLKRHNLYTWIDLELKFNFIKDFIFGANFNISPYTYSFTEDFHHKKFTTHQIMHTNFTRLKSEIFGIYSFNKKFLLRIGFEYLYGSTQKGKTYTDNYSEDFRLTNQKSANDIKEFSVLVGFQIKM